MYRWLAALALLPGTAATQQVFTHDLVTFTFPAGWVAQAPPSTEGGVITSFASSALGASGVVMAGDYGNLKEALQQGLNVVLSGLPGAIPDSLVQELKTDGGDAVLLRSLTGSVPYNGKDVPLQVYLVATVNARRGVLVQLYVAPKNAERARTQLLELIRSIK